MPSWLPFTFVALACPVGMGLMMWFMMRAMRGQHNEPMSSKGAMSPTQRLTRLEAEKEALEREIEASRHEGQTHERSAPIAEKKRA